MPHSCCRHSPQHHSTMQHRLHHHHHHRRPHAHAQPPRVCRPHRRAPSAAPPASHSAPQAAAEPGVAALIDATRGQRFGADSSEQQKEQLTAVIEQLAVHAEQQAAAQVAPTDGPLQGGWRLLWTSEASVHGIIRRQLLGGVSDIQQRVDLQTGRVTNTISFGWLALQLQAAGPLSVRSATRIAYSFDSLALRLGGGLRLPLPLLFKGGGWTEVVVLVDAGRVRVMHNSRQDTLVLQRVDGEWGADA